jgi:hypothetical protein
VKSRASRFPFAGYFRYDAAVHAGFRRTASTVMNRILSLCGFFVLLCVTSPALAGDFGQIEESCYGCMRDVIYGDVKLINHLEANPDVDDAVKGPQIVAARADIHRLRALLGPVVPTETEPCCYSRKRLYIR